MAKAKYNDISFPVKIFFCLSNGLRVISARIKAIENTKIADTIYFYNEDSSKRVAEIAKVIEN
jgi:hypothetical protein